MGMMRGVSLGVKVMMLLGRRVAWWRLNTCACVRGSSGATATAGRQLDAKIGEVVRMRGHAVQERVHHPDLGEILFFFFFFFGFGQLRNEIMSRLTESLVRRIVYHWNHTHKQKRTSSPSATSLCSSSNFPFLVSRDVHLCFLSLFFPLRSHFG